MPTSASVVPNLRLERQLWNEGVPWVAGIDEAGRGAWAGPVVAAAVVLPPRTRIPFALRAVRDSKMLTPLQREKLIEPIRAAASYVGVGIVPVELIDTLGLAWAGQLAFWRAVKDLGQEPSYLLVDGFPLWSPSYPQKAIVRGDQTVLSIAAASVVAKVTRDRMMKELEDGCPAYGFARHKGYGSRSHQAALGALGPSVHHRRSFAPIAQLLGYGDGDADRLYAVGFRIEIEAVEDE
ncbi:MAG TPA: ribonuclease HII [Chloroflexota bacterium]